MLLMVLQQEFEKKKKRKWYKPNVVHISINDM
jgi:hypothetical protein